MADLTQKMLDDYKPYIKESRWDDFVRDRREEVEAVGPVVNILKVYSTDKKRLLEKIYQRNGDLGTPYGCALSVAQAGVDSLPE